MRVCVCEGQLLGNRLLLEEMKTQTLGLLKHPPANSGDPNEAE